MAKAAILMPYPDLKDIFDTLIGNYPRLTPMTVEYVETDKVADKALSLAREGCDLIIARGLQARLIRAAVEIPVIEMRASTQELETLVLDLKAKTKAPQSAVPRLGIIGFFNMFHSTERFNSLLHVDLKVYTATDIDQYTGLVMQAVSDGCQGVIGGEVVMKQASALGLSSSFLSMGEESAREALEAASLVGYSVDLLKRSHAEISAMLDNTAYAIVQVDESGNIRLANRVFCQLSGKKLPEIVDTPVESLIRDLSVNDLHAVLSDAQEIEAAVVTLGHRTALMSIMPVLLDNRVSGAILTFQESARVTEMDSTLRKETARQGQIAHYTFDQIFAANPAFQQVIAQLKRLSRYAVPILLQGESGTGKGYLAQCIHNESLRRDSVFVTLDCSASHPDDLDEKLFGRYSSRKDGDSSAVELARGGTLYIRQVEQLSLETQYKVLQLTRGQFRGNSSNLPMPIDIRLVLSTEANLPQKVREGTFRKDLYYALNALRIDVPPLRSRREDIPSWFNAVLSDTCRAIGRQIHLTDEASSILQDFDWPGNLDQMAGLCVRLVLLSEKRGVSADSLLHHLREMTNEQNLSTGQLEETVINPRAQELLELLNRFHGNREKAAAELGISKTTLWRRMKKYGIARDLTME